MTSHPDNQAADLLSKIAAAGLFPPQRITLALTTECNLQCQHCWLECPRVDQPPERVQTALLDKLLQEFVALGGEELCITGGEPLLHPDWLDILAAGCAHPQIKQATLQTNGTLLDEEIARTLAGGEFHQLAVHVSLDGCSEATHDLVRGPGSYKRAMHGLRCLVAAGLGPKTTLAFTEMRHNFAEIPQLLETAEQLGLSSVVGLPLINSGCAEQSETALLPTSEQYLALLERFDRDAGFREHYEKFGNFAAIEWMRGASASVHPGCRFLEQPYVTAGGLLYPCALLQVDDFAGRGTYERSLAETISAVLPLWADLMQVSQARTTDMACIDRCAGGHHCGGGCLARAYLPGRNLDAREDRCELRQAVYSWCAQRKNPGTR
jgi:radical SAM protein with 4Fe4S-binding SPASM domain